MRSMLGRYEECYHIESAKRFAIGRFKAQFCKQFTKESELNYVAEKLFKEACAMAKAAGKKSSVAAVKKPADIQGTDPDGEKAPW